MLNDPAEWRRAFTAGISGVHPTYPTDGRETIFAPYEDHAPTETVADYLAAVHRVRAGDPDLPADFNDYLTQRVPTTLGMGTERLPLTTRIDRRGVFSPADVEARGIPDGLV